MPAKGRGAALLCILALAAGPRCVVSDLPVHCVLDNAIGTWELNIGSESSEGGERCDSEGDLPSARTLRVELSAPNLATDQYGARGNFTLVYDEGIEIRVGGWRFFSFFRFTHTAALSLAFCHETSIGWYRDESGSLRGCFSATKLNASRSATFVSKDGVQGWVPFRPSTALPVSPSSRVSATAARQGGGDNPLRVLAGGINTLSLGWTTTSYSKLENMTAAALKRIVGGVKGGSLGQGHAAPFAMAARPEEQVELVQVPVSDGSWRQALPKAWDWRSVGGRDYMYPVVEQGSCGSCYAVAAVDMIQTRHSIKNPTAPREELSAQAVLSCSHYSQGCQGGLPFLVAKYAADEGLPTAACMPYSGLDTQCKAMSAGCKERLFVRSYEYVGGYYGGCSEEAMMKEIMAHGPIAVALEVQGDLMVYEGGVYTPLALESPASIPAQVAGALRTWEPTNHAVLCIGWGETAEGRRFWIAKNSWGGDWGEKGYFRIVRGVDAASFESMGVSAGLE